MQPLVVATQLERAANANDDNMAAPLMLRAAKVIRQLWARVAVKKRSTPQHNRFFALIDAAHKHWPSGHEVQALTPDGLREYLQIKAGVGTVHKIQRGEKEYFWFEHKSIAHDKMPQDEFNLLAAKVEDIIENVIGVPADKLLTMDREEV